MLPHCLFEYQQKLSLSDSYISDEYYAVAQNVSLIFQVQHFAFQVQYLAVKFLNFVEQLFDLMSSHCFYVLPVYIIYTATLISTISSL